MKFGNEYCEQCGENVRDCVCTPDRRLSRAQADYDAAVAAKIDADRAANSHYGRVSAAKERLDQAKREVAAQIPVDRTQRTLTDGSPVTADHRDIKPNGQQKGYVVLSEVERAKGFVRPVRRTYVHQKCGVATTMGQSLAETYARNPYFYSGTFCCGCGSHFPVGEDGEFTWDDGSKVGT